MNKVIRVTIILSCAGNLWFGLPLWGSEATPKPHLPSDGPTLRGSGINAPVPAADDIKGEPTKHQDVLASDISPGVVETLRTLHAHNLTAIETGLLAQEKGTLPETRAFGRALAADHKKLDARVMALLKLRSPAAASLSVNATSDGHGMEGLQDQRGVAWDLAFAKMMSADHVKSIQLVRAGRNGISDKQFTSMLSSFLPTLQKIQRTAQKIEAKSAKLTSVSEGR